MTINPIARFAVERRVTLSMVAWSGMLKWWQSEFLKPARAVGRRAGRPKASEAIAPACRDSKPYR